MSEWRTIDSAPKDQTDVLVWDGKEIWIANQDKFGDWSAKLAEATEPPNGFYLDPAGDIGLTHWMPLPPPPSTQEGE